MGTTLSELRRKVLLGIPKVGGEEIAMAEEAINIACHTIAEIQDFEELNVLDTTHARTAIGTKSYHWVTDWGLTRPKNIISIVLHDDYNSRKLDNIRAQTLDKNIPYPDGYADGKSEIYTRRGDYIELVRIPDAVYDLYIRYYQWPLVLTDDTHECSYSNIDGTIIALARDIFLSFRNGTVLDFPAKAMTYLSISVKNDRSEPDAQPIARPFSTMGKVKYTGEYWNNPFVKTVVGG